MTVRVTTAPLSVITCTLVEGAVAEVATTVLRVDDADDCILVSANVGRGSVE